MENRKIFAPTAWLCSLSLVWIGIAGCSSVKKVNYDANTSPAEEVQRMDSDVAAAYSEQYDVLDKEDLSKAEKQLNKAKEQISKGKDRDKILSTLGYSRAYLDRAKQRANQVQDRAQGILEARQAALQAGVRNFPQEQELLRQQDDAFRDDISKLEDGKLSSETWAALQRGYLDLELTSIQKTKLTEARAKVDQAIKNKAVTYAPRSLARAQRDLQNAKNVIATDRHNDATIQPAVDRANASADFLAAVNATAAQRNGDISEDVAIALVKQSRNIHELKNRLKASTEANTAMMNLDQALEAARKAFSPEEAETYRQGEKLLIRLKAINFATGRSELPTEALALLAKVKVIAADLNPQQIVVEGHTDSTGSEQLNEKLSQDRAQAVATYFENNGLDKDKIETVGFGFKKPLASNKTSEGRAQNRRVDVLITPSAAEMHSTME